MKACIRQLKQRPSLLPIDMKNILQYLEKTAERIPNKLALSDEVTTLDFKKLLTLSKSGGSMLSAKGLYNEPVAVFMKKTPLTVCAFFAAIYAGCYYVPLDAGMPKHRIRMILAKLSPRAIVCDESGEALVSELGYGNVTVKADELFSADVDEKRLSDIRKRSIDTDPIYIVFTSGSTGTPKGVTGCHRALIDYAEALCPVIGADEGSVFGMQVPLYVDACMKELLSVIRCGSTAYLMPQSIFMFPVRAIEYLNRCGVNTVCWVASALTMISGLGGFEEAVPESLHTICFGSEVFPIKQLRAWKRACPDAGFINLYGPTEATGMSFYYPVDDSFFDENEDASVVPIGRPFDNTAYLLLRDDDTEAAKGERGEICIRGTALTLGYYDDPERTAAAFTQNPLNPHYPELIYRTGDLAIETESGDLVFVSRKDNQIKNMGHRIELGEIESCAVMCEGVESACCIFSKEAGKLYMYYMGTADERSLQRYLRAELPRHMLPTKIKKLDTLPLLPNGKIDRNKLMEM